MTNLKFLTKIGLVSKNFPTKIGYIPRTLEKKIEKYLALPQIIALVGPRRSGKTTLLFHLKEKLKKATYFSFENQKILELFEKDIENFAKLHLEKSRYLLLDEFHYAKTGGKNLKYLFDFYPGKKIIISGSSSLELTIQAVKYLVGRVLVFTLYPFSFAEFLQAKEPQVYKIWQTTPPKKLVNSPIGKEIRTFFDEYSIFGGYPEVVLQDRAEVKKELLTNIYSILFLREVKDFLSLSDDYKLKSLIQALALQVGNIVNYQELAQISGVDYKTLKKYLNFLQKIFICQLILPFFTNKRKELSKNPKVYFLDTGLRNSIIDNFSSLEQRTDSGALFENTIFRMLAENQEVKFWRTKAKAEVDFVFQSQGEFIPLEAKLGQKRAKIPSSLRSFITTYKPKKAIVITTSFWEETKVESTETFFLPAWLLERELRKELRI